MTMPWYAAVFMLFTMGNVGLPGTSGFVGEILTMTGTYQASTWTAKSSNSISPECGINTAMAPP